MSADLNKIRLLLRARLKTVTGLPDPATMIAWENVSFVIPAPAPDAMWIQEKLLVADATRSSSGLIQTIGQYRINIFVPVGGGAKEAEDMAKKIADAFKSGTSLATVDASLSIHLYKTEPLSGRQDPATTAWYMYPISVSWRNFSPA